MEKIVIAADRMVTSGRITKIEYEHTETKLRVVHNDEVVQCMAVSAGDTSLSDDFFLKLGSKLEDDDPTTVEDIVAKATESYQDMITEAVNRQVLAPFDMDLSELKGSDVELESGTTQALIQDVVEKRDEIVANITVLLAGLDGLGSTLCSIPDGDVARHDSIGYHAIGSGRQPARTSFIRSQYDTECTLDDALLSVVEAKTQSEGAQGVGEKMDIAIIEQDRGCYQFDEPEIEELVGTFEDILEAEENARQSIIADDPYSFDR